MKRTILFLASICVSITAMFSQLYVAQRSGIHLREYGDEKSASLAQLSYGLLIEGISKESYGSATIEGIKGEWRKYSYSNKTGYIFDGFLIPLPTPGNNTSLEGYYESNFNNVSGPVTYNGTDFSGKNQEEITQSVFANGTSITKYSGKGYSSTVYTLTGLNLQKAYVFIRLFSPFSEFLSDAEAFPLTETDKGGKVVKHLYSPDPSVKNLIGLYIQNGGTIFRMRENEGRIEITLGKKNGTN